VADTVTLLGKSTEYRYEKPEKEALEWFENPQNRPENAGKMVIRLDCPEFTSLCPKTGQPDFAKIVIEYTPNQRCVESKSLKLYLFSFRQHGEFHESCVNRIANDLISVLDPLWLKVTGEFMPRGGISIWPVVEYSK
jgi:7-cyano-7-deazaguanine reductase